MNDDAEVIREYRELKGAFRRATWWVIGLLLTIIVAGGSLLLDHGSRLSANGARITSLEDESKKGDRWTAQDEDRWQAEYRRDMGAMQSRVEAVEALMVSISNQSSATQAKLDYLIEHVRGVE